MGGGERGEGGQEAGGDEGADQTKHASSQEPWRGSDGAGEDAGNQKRRIFLEFYGPIVGVFSAVGFPAWLAELATVAATQLCPLLAAAPLLRLNPLRMADRDTPGTFCDGIDPCDTHVCAAGVT